MSADDEQAPIIIVGAGEAGGRAAIRLRERGYRGALTLVSGEGHLPYDRPALSKTLLTAPEAALAFHAPADFYARQKIAVEPAMALRLDPAARRLTLDDGRRLDYSRLMLCCGAAPRQLGVPGGDLPGVVYLRDAAQAFDLRTRLAGAARVLVVGGGFIGLEVAASARALNCRVTLVEKADRLMARTLPAIVGATFADAHRDQGVDLRLGIHPVAFAGGGQLDRVRLSDGTVLKVDVAVVGVGVVPRDGLARAAGLRVADGIVVDEEGRTSDPHIFAAGDAVCQPNGWARRMIRLESWQSARDQADRAADAMLGHVPAPCRSPWMWSDQYEHNLQVLGVADPAGDFVVRGDPGERGYALFQLRDGKLVAAITVDRAADMAVAKKLVAAATPVRPEQLADPGVRLKSLVA